MKVLHLNIWEGAGKVSRGPKGGRSREVRERVAAGGLGMPELRGPEEGSDKGSHSK